MKRITILLIFLLVITLISTPGFAESQIEVIVNGEYLSLDVPPVIIEGRTLLPLRGIFEALGITPHWNGQTRSVSAQTLNNSISLTIDSKTAVVNNNMVELDVPARIMEGRTMVPARFIAESLGADVQWEDSKRTVVIQTNSFTYLSNSDKNVSTFFGKGFYMGEAIDGRPNGYGTFTMSDGSMIIGKWEDGIPIEASFFGPISDKMEDKFLADGKQVNEVNNQESNETSTLNNTNNTEYNNNKISDYRNGLLEKIDYLINEFESIEGNIINMLEEYDRVYENELRTAQIDIDKEKEYVNQQAYLEYERTKAYASEMGITNSAQMEGLLSSTKSEFESIINELDNAFKEYQRNLMNWRDSNQEPLENDLSDIVTYIEELNDLRKIVLDSDSMQELIEIDSYLD